MDRGKRAAERRFRETNFPVIKTMDTYDFKAQPSINERLIQELMRANTLTKRKMFYFLGIHVPAKRIWRAL